MQRFDNQWLITKYEVLNHKLPANPKLTAGLSEVNPETTLHKTPPSQDPNADRLARVHGPQVSRTIKRLCESRELARYSRNL